MRIIKAKTTGMRKKNAAGFFSGGSAPNKILSVILVIILMFISISRGISDALNTSGDMMAEPGALWDLAIFQVDLIIREAGDDSAPLAGHCRYGVIYNFTMCFAIPMINNYAQSDIMPGDDLFGYYLPAGLDIIDTGPGEIYAQGDPLSQIGEYEIVGNVSNGSTIKAQFYDINAEESEADTEEAPAGAVEAEAGTEETATGAEETATSAEEAEIGETEETAAGIEEAEIGETETAADTDETATSAEETETGAEETATGIEEAQAGTKKTVTVIDDAQAGAEEVRVSVENGPYSNEDRASSVEDGDSAEIEEVEQLEQLEQLGQLEQPDESLYFSIGIQAQFLQQDNSGEFVFGNGVTITVTEDIEIASPEIPGVEDSSTGEETAIMADVDSEDIYPEFFAANDFIGISPTSAGDLWDLGTFQENFEITDSDLTEIPLTEEFEYGSMYFFKVHFMAPNGMFSYPAYKDGWLYYALPPGVDILYAGTGDIRLDIDPTVPIGMYDIDSSIDDGGYIKVRFFNYKVENGELKETEDVNLIDSEYQTLSFWVEFQARFIKQDGGDSFVFGNDTTINMKAQEDDPGDDTGDDNGDDPEDDPDDEPALDVSKEGLTYNAAARTMDYRITLTAKNGDIDISRLTDTPMRGYNTTLEDIFTGKSVDDFILNPVVRLGGGVIDSSDYDIRWIDGGRSFEILFKDTVTIPEGESMRLTYTFDYSDVVAKHGEPSSLSYSNRVGNIVEVYGPDEHDAEELLGDDSSASWIGNVFSSKTGSYDAGGNMITWTATLGDYSTALNGWTVTDELGAGGMDPEGTLQIVFKDRNGAVIHNETYTGPTGAPLDLLFNDDGYGGFTFTIPGEGAGSPLKDIYRAELTYIVEVTAGSDVIMRNTLTISDGQETSDTATSPGVPVKRGAASVTKNGMLVFGDAEFGDYVQWEIKYFVPGDMHDIPVWFDDTLYLHTGLGEAPGKQLLPPYEMVDFKVSCNDDSFGPLIFSVNDQGKYYYDGVYYDNYDDMPPIPGQNMSLVYRPVVNEWPECDWRLFFNPGGAKDINGTNHVEIYSQNDSDKSPSPFTHDTTVTVSYKIPLGLQATGYPDGTALLDVIKKSEAKSTTKSNQPSIRNTATISYWPTGSLWNPDSRSYDAGVYYPVFKWAEVVGDRIDYTVLLDVRALNDEKIFTDKFDGGILEYVPYSFRADIDASRFYGPYDYSDNPAIYDYIALDYETSKGVISYNFFDLQAYSSGSTIVLSLDANGMPEKPGSIAFPVARPDKLGDSDSPGYRDDYYWTVRYSLKVKESVGWGKYTLRNVMSLGDYENECIVETGENPVSKTVRVNAGGTASVEIIINPQGQKVLANSASADVYRAEDLMSENLAYIPNTLKFWTRDDGDPEYEWTPVDPALAEHAVERDALPWTYRINDANDIHFWFPDETPVRVTYHMRAQTADDDTFTNKITVLSYWDEVMLEGFDVDSSYGNSNLDVTDLLIIKKDSVSEMPVAGAEFGLYISFEYSRNFDGNMAMAEANGYPKTFDLSDLGFIDDADDITFYYVEDGVTDEGFLSFYKELYSQEIFKDLNIVYAIYEKEAPPGYLGPKGCDIEEHDDLREHLTFFYFQPPAEEILELITGLGFAPYDSYGAVEIFNEPDDAADDLEFTFYKVDERNRPMENVRFALYYCELWDDAGHTHDWMAAGGQAGCWGNPVYAISGADGRVEFNDLIPGHYMLVETATHAGYQLPHGQWLIAIAGSTDITITAHGMSASAMPPAFKHGAGAMAGELLLPNYPGMAMPLAGGIGVALMTAAGIAMLGGAACYLILSAPARKKKAANKNKM